MKIKYHFKLKDMLITRCSVPRTFLGTYKLLTDDFPIVQAFWWNILFNPWTHGFFTSCYFNCTSMSWYLCLFHVNHHHIPNASWFSYWHRMPSECRRRPDTFPESSKWHSRTNRNSSVRGPPDDSSTRVGVCFLSYEVTSRRKKPVNVWP